MSVSGILAVWLAGADQLPRSDPFKTTGCEAVAGEADADAGAASASTSTGKKRVPLIPSARMVYPLWDYLMTAIVSPVATEPPADTFSSSILPEDGAVISFSIFMASITQMSAPSSTSAPFSTSTFRTVPWIGDTSSPGAPPPPPPPRLARLGAFFAGADPLVATPTGAAPITFTSNLRPETSTA